MPKKKMMVEWDDDAQLSESRKKPGQKSPLTRDANNKLSHVTLSEVADEDSTASADPVIIYVTDPPEPDTRARDDGRIEMALEAARLVIEKAPEWAPVLQRLWIEQGSPLLQSTWNRRPQPRVFRKRSQEVALDSVPTLSAADNTKPSLEPAPRTLDESLVGINFSEAGNADIDHAHVPVKPAKAKRVLRQRRVR